MATVTLSSIMPSTSPSNGWKVTYRILGTGGPFLTAAGSPFSSQPIVFATGDPSNTDYEGYVVTDCGSGNLGTQYYWETANLVFSITKVSGDVVNMAPFINGSFSKVDWGDGTVNTSLTHTYSTSSTFTIKFYSSTTTKFDNKTGGPAFLGRLNSLTVLPPAVTNLNIYVDSTFSSLDTLAPNTAIINLRINNELHGLTSFPSISTFTSLQVLNFIGYNLNILNVTNNTLLTTINVSDSVLTSITGLSATTLITSLEAGNNNLSVSEVNSILVQLDTHGLSNGTLTLTGQVPAATPTGTGLTAKTSLQGKGWTVLTD